jgi:hypothetical protein
MPPPAATQAAARLWTQLTSPFPACHSYRSSDEITRTLWWQMRFTQGCVREWRSGHNSITVQNRTCLYELFWSQRPRKSPPAVMPQSRETPCIVDESFSHEEYFLWLVHCVMDWTFNINTWSCKWLYHDSFLELLFPSLFYLYRTQVNGKVVPVLN